MPLRPERNIAIEKNVETKHIADIAIHFSGLVLLEHLPNPLPGHPKHRRSQQAPFTEIAPRGSKAKVLLAKSGLQGGAPVRYPWELWMSMVYNIKLI